MATFSVTVYENQNQVLIIGGGTSGSRLQMTDGDVLSVFHNSFLSSGGTITVSSFSSTVWTSTLNIAVAQGATQTRTVKTGATGGTINLSCTESGSSAGTIFINIAGEDTTPNAFSLGSDITANPSEVVYFSPVTIAGMDASASVTATATNGLVAYQNGTGAQRTFATSKTGVSNGDVLLTKATAPTGYSQNKTVTLTVGANPSTADSAILYTAVDPASGEVLSLGITSGAIDMDSILDLFMGQSQAFWSYVRPSDMGSLYRSATYVPNITANSNIATSGAISLSQFYGCETSYYLTLPPPSKSVFTDTSGGGSTFNAQLYWELGTDFEIGYGPGMKYNSELKYAVTQNIGSVTGTYATAYGIGQNTILLQKTVNANVEEFNSGVVTVYIRSLVDSSKVITRTFNYSINFFGP
tara:strand:+ start:1566 stop:2804 length:1239 start_codon:yes stop_codon:yes gene_type:complete